MAGTSRPSSSSNTPSGSQIMPQKLRAVLEKTEQEIKELHDIYTLKEREKHESQKSIEEKRATVRSINKDICKEERKINLLEQEFPMLDEELRNKYTLVATIKEIYPEGP
jgi:cell division protein FtsB